jgi:hypothetical protein
MDGQVPAIKRMRHQKRGEEIRRTTRKINYKRRMRAMTPKQKWI